LLRLEMWLHKSYSNYSLSLIEASRDP
jgi:hypothetical protein